MTNENLVKKQEAIAEILDRIISGASTTATKELAEAYALLSGN